VFSAFKTVIYLDRLPPVAVFDSFHPLGSAPGDNEVWIRSVDFTADTVHVFANLPGAMPESEILALVAEGHGRLERLDRALFKGVLRGLPRGDNALTIVTFEPTGTRNIQRVTAVVP
jgi:hypothetical protein